MRVWGIWVSLAALGISGVAAADETITCTRDTAARVIRIVEAPSADRACEVRYQKSSTGAPAEVLWHAANDAAFCDRQADMLAGRLNGAGWACAPGDDANAETQAANAAMPSHETPGAPPAEPLSSAIAIGVPSGVTAATEKAPVQSASPAVAAGNVPAAGEGTPTRPSRIYKLRPSLH